MIQGFHAMSYVVDVAAAQINGRVWWDDRHGQFLLAGLWQDEEGAPRAVWC